MKPQIKPFVVEIKHGRRDQKSPTHSIWGDIDMAAYGLSECQPKIPAEGLTAAKTAAPESTIRTAVDMVPDVKPSAPPSVGIIIATGLHYVQVRDNGAKHELIGPFRTREQAQSEAAKWTGALK